MIHRGECKIPKKKIAKENTIKQTIKCGHVKSGSGGMVYVLGFIGAAVYYISIATGFWNGVLGFSKAIVWPAFLVYEALKFLGM